MNMISTKEMNTVKFTMVARVMKEARVIASVDIDHVNKKKCKNDTCTHHTCSSVTYAAVKAQ